MQHRSYPKSPPMRCRGFSDSIHKTFEYFWQSGKFSDIGWTASLDKLVEKNNEFKTSIGNLKSSTCEHKLIKENKELRDQNY